MIKDDTVRVKNLQQGLATMPVIAIVRGDYARVLAAARPILHEYGLRALEITLNSSNALDTIARLSPISGNMIIGAGTLTRVEEVRAAICAGAQFLVCPHTNISIIQRARHDFEKHLDGAALETWR